MAANYKISIEHHPASEKDEEGWAFNVAFKSELYPTAEAALAASKPFYQAAASIEGHTDGWVQTRLFPREVTDRKTGEVREVPITASDA